MPEEQITTFEDHVQSMDVDAFNKSEIHQFSFSSSGKGPRNLHINHCPGDSDIGGFGATHSETQILWVSGYQRLQKRASTKAEKCSLTQFSRLNRQYLVIKEKL